MPRQHHDIACAKTGSCVLTPFSVAYTTSISGRQRALIEFLRMTAVGTGMLLVKFSDNRLVKQIRKQNTLSCAIVIHARASFMLRNACGKGFLARSRLLRFSISNHFANYV